MGFLNADEQIGRVNERTPHFLLSPIALIENILMVFGTAGLAILVGIVCWFGWIVDVGPRSQRARDAEVAQIVTNFAQQWNGQGNWVVNLRIDFRNRPSWSSIRGEFADEPWNSPEHLWVTDPSPYPDTEDLDGDERQYRDTILPFIVTDAHSTVIDHGIPFCQVGHAALNDTGLGTWSERADPKFLLNRKAGRMHRDYETVAMMTAALRSALAHLTAGQTLASENGPLGTFLPSSFCDAEGVAPGALTPEQVAAYRAATYQIHLPDAPVVRMRYVYFGIDRAQIDEPDDPKVKLEYQWRDGGAEITGMCLADDCDQNGDGKDDALNFQTTYWDDLFAKDPPLGPGQLAAEEAMLRTGTMDLWLKEARANGITDMKPLYAMHERAEANLNVVLSKVH